MLKAGVTITQVDHIIYTHLHIDHTADFAPFLFAAQYAPGLQRTKDLVITGPAGIRQFYEKLKDVYGAWITPDNFSIVWTEMTKGSKEFSDFIVTAAPVKHTLSSIAVRLQDHAGKVVVYSGDTDYCRSIVDLAVHADVLILECAFPEHMRCEGHLVPSLAGKIAQESECKKLVLTHFYPQCDTADLLSPLRKYFSGELIIAQDLMTIRL